MINSLRVHDINLVLDVGANTGQFGQNLRALGYTGHIVSFEPLSGAHRVLVKTASRDKKWSVPQKVAIGGHSGTVEIHVSANSVSSSVLAMLDAHVAAAPESA